MADEKGTQEPDDKDRKPITPGVSQNEELTDNDLEHIAGGRCEVAATANTDAVECGNKSQ